MIKNDTLEFIKQNQQTYSDTYESMTWLSPETAENASRVRDGLIKAIFEHPCRGAGKKFAQTKPYVHGISPGCELCGQGNWSCLFINGICNARCFYCPSAQTEKGQPMTSSVVFSNAHEYADYVNAFNIKGVSFSGGEPLMTFEKVLMFLKTLRVKVSRSLYIWMYTNGILVTEDKLKILRDNGLDEIRFDISATHYALDALKKAVGIIPTVTVEIPAIPEDLEKIRKVIHELHAIGVNYLNLHQLRCTSFNTAAFIKRGYTFLHGPGVTVLETELAALDLIRYSLDQNIGLPINYCSFTYRNQFQGSSARKRTARFIKSSHEDITPTGHIRSMSLCNGEKQIRSIHARLVSEKIDTTLYKLSKDGTQLFFNASLWPHLDFSSGRLKVSYSTSALKSAVSYRHAFKEIHLGKGKKVAVERMLKQPGLWFEGEQIHQFGLSFIQPESESSSCMTKKLSQELLNDAKKYEVYDSGLAEYY